MNTTTENIVKQSWTYSSPIIRHYRLRERTDLVPKDELPWEFVDSNKRISSQTNRAFAEDGPATALFRALPYPYLYTLYGEQLGIPVKYRHARCIRSRKALKVWREALQRHFKGAYLYKFEVGLESEVVHVHVVANVDAAFLEMSRFGNLACEPVTNPKGMIRYLEKPPCYPIRKRVKEYQRAVKDATGTKLPKVSGYVGLPSKAERFVSEQKPIVAVTDSNIEA